MIASIYNNDVSTHLQQRLVVRLWQRQRVTRLVLRSNDVMRLLIFQQGCSGSFLPWTPAPSTLRLENIERGPPSWSLWLTWKFIECYEIFESWLKSESLSAWNSETWKVTSYEQACVSQSITTPVVSTSDICSSRAWFFNCSRFRVTSYLFLFFSDLE